MADKVTSQVLENGPVRLVMKFTDLSDGTGESAVKKVDAQSLVFGVVNGGVTFVPGTTLVVVGIIWNVVGMTLRMQWEATADVELVDLGGYGQWDFRDQRAGFGGLANPMTAGSTGSILFTTAGQSNGSSYSVILEMIRGMQVPQSAPPPSGGAIELESGLGHIELENGSGVILLEG